MLQNNYLCIDKNFGFNKKITNKEQCNSNNGQYIHKDDWINPETGYTCQSSNTGQIYFSKNQCDIAALEDNSVEYSLKPPEKEYNINKKFNKLPLDREWSRLKILIITYYLIIFFIIILAFTTLKTNFNNYERNIIIVILIIIPIIFIIGLYIFIFCPWNICYLDPTMPLYRTNTIMYIYKLLCKLLNKIN